MSAGFQARPRNPVATGQTPRRQKQPTPRLVQRRAPVARPELHTPPMGPVTPPTTPDQQIRPR